MCLAGPRWRPNREIAWHTERLLHHVRYTNSKRSPSSNAINPVFMGFQMQFFFQIYVSSGQFWLRVVFICERAPAKLKCFFQRRLYSININCFVRDYWRLYLTFVAFYLLSVSRKQQLKQCNYSVDQSALLTGFRTDFKTQVSNFCRESQTFLLAKRPQRRGAGGNGCFHRIA